MSVLKRLVWFLGLLTAVSAHAGPTVFQATVDEPLDAVYDRVYEALEEARFFVVFEPNIGANLARFKDRWGDDYNRNGLTALRSMVFCNGWYANRVSNLDPAMLGMCPLHLSLYEKGGKTTVLFNRPTVIAVDSPAKAVFERVEADVIEAIRKGLGQ